MRRAGIEVWLAGRGGNVDGSEGLGAAPGDPRSLYSLALTSIKSSLVNASPVIGSVPFSSTRQLGRRYRGDQDAYRYISRLMPFRTLFLKFWKRQGRWAVIPRLQ